jgi:hypothetical protein
LEKKCELECLRDSEGNLYDNVDFCDVEQIPRVPSNATTLSVDLFLNWNATYIHSSMWRYLAIGDSFVDAFMSRDLDMEIFDREIQAVNEWLDSDKAGHIMRGYSTFFLNTKLKAILI